MNKKTKILMCSYPQSNRGPGNAFNNHLSSINNSDYFDIDLINENHIQNIHLLEKYDIFWFSIRFHCNLYYFLKQNFPNKIYIMGPNVLFEKAEIGPSDDWERWFVNEVNCDIYFNKADFYLKRAKEFFKRSKAYEVLPNCIDQKNLEDLRIKNKNIKNNKVLVYSKKRRIDKQFDILFPKLISALNKEKIDFDIVTYGNYEKKDFLEMLPSYSCCFWFSIEDFCSNAQLEVQSVGVPIIGTMFNTTHTYDKNLITKGAKLTKENWITWESDVADMYINCYKENYNKFNNVEYIEKRIKYILEFHSYSSYAKNLNRIINDQ